MKKVYAVFEGERARGYITPGGKYEVLSSGQAYFTIKDNAGELIWCAWYSCPHLNGGNWTRIEEDEEAPQPEQKTLRDEFAMAALIGVLACESRDSRENFAEACYKMADAMLEARKK